MTSTQDILEALDSLVESHFGDSLASSIVATNTSLFLSVWKQPQTQTDSLFQEISMKYLPLFYIIGSIEDRKLSLKLITYHGKIIDEVNEKDFPMDDGNKLGFIGKLNEMKLCQGMCLNGDECLNGNIQSNVLLEQLEDNIVTRSRECQFAVFDDQVVCDNCECMSMEDLKRETFHPEPKSYEALPGMQDDEVIYETADRTEEPLDEPYDEEYLPSTPEIEKKKKVMKRKGTKRRLNRNSKSVFKCKHCVFETDKKETMTSHIIANHVRIKKIQCTHCEYKSGNLSNMALHTQEVHNLEFSKDKDNITFAKDVEYMCEMCDFVTTKKEYLKKHNSSVHETKEKLSCEQCTFSTRRPNKMTEHIQKVHEKLCSFQCEQCPYKFAYKRELDKHISAVHMKIKPFLCNFCSYETAYKSQLSWHINIVHNKVKPFLCEYCPYKTSQKRNLTLHNRCKHEMIKPVKCTYDDCTYETISTSRLTTHIKFVHQKIKPFVCQLCPFATDTNYHLQNHINVRHSTTKPFKCTQCNYEGARKNYLTDHIRAVHDKIKRFKCELCTYETTSKYSLNKHVNAVHEKVKTTEETIDPAATTTIINTDVVTTTTPIVTMPPMSAMTPMATVTLNDQGIMQVMHVTAVTDGTELMC